MKVLLISEQSWPEGTGCILAFHLIIKILRGAGLELTVVHGARRAEPPQDIECIHAELLGARDKRRS